MNKHISKQWLAMYIGFLTMFSVWLTSCAPQGATAESPIPTPVNAVFLQSSPMPIPTSAGSKLVRGTPSPNSKVYVGDMTDLASVASAISPRYSIRNKFDSPGIWKLFVDDAKTGSTTRLGDDNGSALSPVITDRYVVWEYLCAHQCDQPASLKSGIYGYDLDARRSFAIVTGPGTQSSPKVDGQWIIYVDIANRDVQFAPLHAHNIVTGDDIFIGKSVPVDQGYPPSDFYAMGDNQIAWVEAEPSDTVANWQIHVYDLTTRTSRPLNVPNTLFPVNLSISDDIVVWWDGFWSGYDLKQDILFSIPITPPGWENIHGALAEPVTIQNGHLYWALKVNDQVHHFSAPIIRDK